MTRDEARELFSDAYDDELPDAQRGEFEAALASDADLSAEFEDFARLLRSAPAAIPDVPAPDLLRGVQRRIRRTTHGRYYNDRFGEHTGRGGVHPLWMALLMLLVLLGMWAVASSLRLAPRMLQESPESGTATEAPESSTPGR